VGAASAEQSRYDYPRLQRAVEALLDVHEQLRAENTELRAALASGDERVHDLEAALRDQQQRRAAAIARIDALVSQLEKLDGQLERAEASRAADVVASVHGSAAT
jgi:predicted nuclease with TOPRIM domain